MNADTTHSAAVDEALADSTTDRWLSVEQAAEAVGRHPESIRRWVRDGLVDARPRTQGSLRGNPVEILERSLRAKVSAMPASKAVQAPAGGGIYDPNWGPFTRDPFPRD